MSDNLTQYAANSTYEFVFVCRFDFPRRDKQVHNSGKSDMRLNDNSTPHCPRITLTPVAKQRGAGIAFFYFFTKKLFANFRSPVLCASRICAGAFVHPKVAKWRALRKTASVARRENKNAVNAHRTHLKRYPCVKKCEKQARLTRTQKRCCWKRVALRKLRDLCVRGCEPN